MIIVTYKKWLDTEYTSGYYQEYTSIYVDKSDLREDMKKWEKNGNPMIISGIWKL